MNYESSVDSERADLSAPPEGLQPEGEAPDKRRRIATIALAAIAVLAILFWMLMGGTEGDEFEGAGEQTPAVTVVSPGRVTIEGAINATGTLAARRELPVGVTGEGGRVVSVPVEPGQWVGAGQILAVIDRSVQSQQARSAAAQVQVARADAELAEANLQRALQLVERGFISQADIDRLTATRDAANARVSVAEAQLGERQARNAQLNIVAPSAGLLLTRNVEPGQTVSPGSGVLFSIAKGGEMELLAEVGETELARITPGVKATVTPVGSDKSFSGQVWQVSPVINEQDRQGTARIALSYAPELRPGGFATAEIISGTSVSPRLPESAILSDDNGSYVYIVDKDNKVVRRPVKLGVVSDQGIAIDEGLDGTERIVVRAGGFLTAGEEVRPVSPSGN